MAIDRASNAQSNAIGYRNIDKAFCLYTVVIAIDQTNAALKYVGWLGTGERYIAAKTIASKQCALRALLHLDSLQIYERSDCLLRARLIDLVNVKTDARIRISANRFGVDAPDRWSSRRPRTGDTQARYRLLEPSDVAGIRVTQFGASDRGN